MKYFSINIPPPGTAALEPVENALLCSARLQLHCPSILKETGQVCNAVFASRQALNLNMKGLQHIPDLHASALVIVPEGPF